MDRRTLFLLLVQTEALCVEMSDRRWRWPWQSARRAGMAAAVVANAAVLDLDEVYADLHLAAKEYVAYAYGLSDRRPPFAKIGPIDMVFSEYTT